MGTTITAVMQEARKKRNKSRTRILRLRRRLLESSSLLPPAAAAEAASSSAFFDDGNDGGAAAVVADDVGVEVFEGKTFADPGVLLDHTLGTGSGPMEDLILVSCLDDAESSSLADWESIIGIMTPAALLPVGWQTLP